MVIDFIFQTIYKLLFSSYCVIICLYYVEIELHLFLYVKMEIYIFIIREK